MRELGTLKALGWTQRLVVRQVVGESLAQGIVGGLLGVVLGVVATAGIVGAFGGDADRALRRAAARRVRPRRARPRAATRVITLHAPISVELLVLGFLLAIIGGLIAGAAGALRAARLRPADALRTVE